VIYLDNNATTQVDQRVLQSMLPFLEKFYGNPSGLYRSGRIARSAIETAREQVAELVAADPGQIVFTCSGTEANNLVLKGFSGTAGIAVATTEHPSVLETANIIKQQGRRVEYINVDASGEINLDPLTGLSTQDIGLVSVMLANNETGVLQNIQPLVGFCRRQGIRVHTDAVQAAGKIKINFNNLAVDYMSLSSHKIYGPKGCGALVVAQNSPLSPLLTGGSQEQGMRAGTENVAAIVGFGQAAEIARQTLDARTQKLLELRKFLETGLLKIPELVIFALDSERLPNTVQFGIAGIEGEMLLMQLDQKGIAVSSGSACKSGGKTASHVLLAMGVSPALAKSAVRVSLGQYNTLAEVEDFLASLKELLEMMKPIDYS